MKALFNREALLSAVQLANVAIPARDVKPILRNFKAMAEEGRCTLMATDLELGIRVEMRSLKGEEPGEAILPAAKLLAILRECPDEELRIEADTNSCQVSGVNGNWKMPSEDPANFPDLPAFAEEKYHLVKAGQLREMIRRTVFAAATDVGRYSMTGVLWELDDEKIKLVATDGRRLALMEGPAECHGEHTTKRQTPVVPTKAMNLLERNLQDDEEQVRVSFRPNEVLFRTEGATVYSRLVEGRFPNYRDVFPKKQKIAIPLPVGGFLAAVRQAAIMTDEDSKKVVFHFAPRRLTLEAQGSVSGRSEITMPLEYTGKGMDISFNPGFLVDMLRVLEPDTALHLDLVDAASPALFRTEDHYQYLLMPLS